MAAHARVSQHLITVPALVFLAVVYTCDVFLCRLSRRLLISPPSISVSDTDGRSGSSLLAASPRVSVFRQLISARVCSARS